MPKPNQFSREERDQIVERAAQLMDYGESGKALRSNLIDFVKDVFGRDINLANINRVIADAKLFMRLSDKDMRQTIRRGAEAKLFKGRKLLDSDNLKESVAGSKILGGGVEIAAKMGFAKENVKTSAEELDRKWENINES